MIHAGRWSKLLEEFRDERAKPAMCGRHSSVRAYWANSNVGATAVERRSGAAGPSRDNRRGQQQGGYRAGAACDEGGGDETRHLQTDVRGIKALRQMFFQLFVCDEHVPFGRESGSRPRSVQASVVAADDAAIAAF